MTKEEFYGLKFDFGMEFRASGKWHNLYAVDFETCEFFDESNQPFQHYDVDVVKKKSDKLSVKLFRLAARYAG